MLSHLLHQGQRRRAQDPDAGFTLIEVVVAIILLAIIMVPLTAAFIQGLRRSGEVSDRLSRSADLQRITNFWTRDVGNVDSDGVNSWYEDPNNPGVRIVEVCRGSNASETSAYLVSLRWDGKIEGATPKIATWALVGEGEDAKLRRRLCEGGVLVDDAIMADAFGVDGLDPLQMVWGTTPQQDNYCPVGPATSDASQRCTINVGGAYSYTVVAERRVRGAALPGAPPPPEIVDCQAGPGLVTVTWNPSVLAAEQLEVEEYRASVYRNAAGSGTPVETVFVDGTSTSASVPAVISSPGEEFWVRVGARNAIDWGAYSVPCGPVAPDPSAPGKPTAVIATPGDKTASVDWTDPATGGSPITNYTIFLKDGDTETQFSTSNKPFQLPSGSLVNARPYQFAVQATNLLGTGPRSDLSPIIYPFGPTLPMNQPSVGEIAPGGVGTGAYRLAWTQILPPSAPVCLNPPASGDPRELALKACISNGSPVTEYRVELTSVDPDGTEYPVAGFPTTVPQPTVPANPTPNLGGVIVDTPVLPRGRTYFALITPINAAGDGSPGFVEFELTAVAPGPPGLPSISNNGNSGQLDFVLRQPTDTGGAPITSYQITTAGGRSATVTAAASGDTTFTWSSATATGPALVDFESYGFVIRACNSAGCGTASPAYNALPVPTPQLDVRAVTYPSPGNVRLEFTYATGFGYAPETANPLRRSTYNATCGAQTTGTITFASATPVIANFGPFPIGPVTCTIILQSRGQTVVDGLPNSAAQATSPISVPVVIQEPPTAVGPPTIAATGASGELAFQIPAPSYLGGAEISEVTYEITTSGGRSASVPAVAGTTPFAWNTGSATGPALADFTAYAFSIRACNREGCGPATGSLQAMALPSPSVDGLTFDVPATGTARLAFTYAAGTGTSPAQASPVSSTSYSANCGGAAASTTFASAAPVQVDFTGIPVEARTCSVILSSTGVSTLAGAPSTTTIAGAPATTGQFLVAPAPATPTIVTNQTSQQLRFRVTEAMPAGVTNIGIERVGGGQPLAGPVPLTNLTPSGGWIWSTTGSSPSASVALTNFQRELFRLRSCNAGGVCGPWSPPFRGMSAPRPQLQLVSSSSPAPGVARATFRFVDGTGVAPATTDPLSNIAWRFSCTGGSNPASGLTFFDSGADVTADITGLAAGPNACTLTTQSRVETTLNGTDNTQALSPSPSTLAVPLTIQ